MRKTTLDLEIAIKSAPCIEKYLSENSDETFDIDFTSYLNELQEKKGFKHTYIFNRGNIEKRYGYSLFKGGHKKPSRDFVLRLCFGLELDIAQSQLLLRIAKEGALYARDKRDSAIMFCLENKTTALECETLLSELNMTPLKGGE